MASPFLVPLPGSRWLRYHGQGRRAVDFTRRGYATGRTKRLGYARTACGPAEGGHAYARGGGVDRTVVALRARCSAATAKAMNHSNHTSVASSTRPNPAPGTATTQRPPATKPVEETQRGSVPVTRTATATHRVNSPSTAMDRKYAKLRTSLTVVTVARGTP